MFVKASVVHYGIEWPCMALCGLVWPCTDFLPYMGSYGLAWSYMAFYGKISILLDLYRLFRGHRSKFIWSCLISQR